MTFLDQFGAALGVGACKVSVVLAKTVYCWDETARGTVRLEGGKVDQHATELRASVREHWITRGSKGEAQHHYRHYATMVLEQALAIAPDSLQEFPFTIQVPDGGDLKHEWAVEARAAIPLARDPRGTAAFTLEPPAAIRGLAAALRQVAPFELRERANKQAVAHLDFRPPKDRPHALDGVKLMVSETNGEVTGILEVNPQERSAGDHLRALLHKDRIRHPIAFRAAALAANPDGPAPREVVAALAELLEPHLQPR